MAKPRVLHSYNLDGDLRCVDIFVRDDRTFGFEDYRRDPEDGKGWFAVGFHGDQRFPTEADAMATAMTTVSWLADVLKRHATPHDATGSS